MKAENLKLNNFRNIENEIISFSDGVNVIWGENAQGKTNILESLWFFSVGKSFRAARDREMVSFNKEKAFLELSFISDKREQKISAEIPETGRKKVFINGVKTVKASEIAGSFTSVLFSPEHLTLIKDGSLERRKFLDCAITLHRPAYVDLLINYNKTLEQKNAALKKAAENKSYYETLEIWDKKLSLSGAKIILIRDRYINLLKSKAKDIHFKLTEGKESLDIDYLSAAGQRDNEKETENELYSLFEKNRKEDILKGFTSIGPQREDIDISINNIKARAFASQGQQRSCVLSLKIAEAELLEEEYGEKPVLLLDDVLSELDMKRQKFILEEIGKGQVIITCCESERFLKTVKNAKAINVQGGKIFT